MEKNKKNTAKPAEKSGQKNSAAPKKTGNQAPKKRHYTSGRRKSGKAGTPLRITPLGGLDEIGKNITLYEYQNDMLLVDCGMAFPDEDLPGVDIVIPDFTHVIKNKDKIRGLLVTHGHEDHIGSIPYLLKEFNVPIYGTKLTLGLIMGKLREHGLHKSAVLHEVKPGDTVQLGAFSVEFIHVNHSSPDALAMAIRCPAGLVVQTGDFKIDTTPIDNQMIDIARFAELGKEGVWRCCPIRPTPSAPAIPPASGWWATPSRIFSSVRMKTVSVLSSPPSRRTFTEFSRSWTRRFARAARWRCRVAA